MRVQVGDVKLFFDVDGAKLLGDGPKMRERPTLLLLHGGPGFDHSIYKVNFPALADACQLIYLDHRGNGRSDRGDPSRWTLDQWADDVKLFCDALEIEKPVVFGASFGSMVAMNYAMRHPGHPRKLILASCAARINFERGLPVFERLGGPIAREIAAKFWQDPSDANFADFMRVCLPLYTRTPLPADVVARIVINRDVMNTFFKGEIRTFDFRAGLARIECPTLVLSGEDDPVTTVEDAREVAAALPRDHTTFKSYPGARHGVTRDAPEALDDIRAFVLGARQPND